MSNWWNIKKTIAITMKYKFNFVKMINKINIFLGIIIKGKKKKRQIININISNKKENPSTSSVML